MTNTIYVSVDGTKRKATSEEILEIEKYQTEEQQNILANEAKQKTREDAIKKLGEIAGLTKEELDAIL